MAAFVEALLQRGILMDGAMGTQLIARGHDASQGLERLNLQAPDAVLAVHNEYVAAGARVLLTNTFQAGVREDTEARLGDVVSAGVALARQAVADRGYVLGDLGPVLVNDEGLRHLVRLFGGADGLLLETQSDFDLLDRVLRRKTTAAPQFPILFAATFQNVQGQICTHAGLSATQIARLARQRPIQALGVNCGKDMNLADITAVLASYRSECSLPLFARPNAGQPRQEGNRWIYPMSPGQFADAMREELKKNGVMVGGCCGTTPSHIAELRGRS